MANAKKTEDKHPPIIMPGCDTALFYDTETTGLPDWHKPSGEEHQPHIVQLGAQAVDLKSREILHTMDLMIRPAGWIIPREASDVHGITTERAEEFGVSERVALTLLFDIWSSLSNCVLVGHSEKFDRRIIRIAQHRFQHSESIMDEWKHAPGQDTGYMARKGMEAAGAGTYKGRAMPKLVDAYQHYVGSSFAAIDHHTAIGDCDATRRLYFAIIDAHA